MEERVLKETLGKLEQLEQQEQPEQQERRAKMVIDIQQDQQHLWILVVLRHTWWSNQTWLIQKAMTLKLFLIFQIILLPQYNFMIRYLAD
jgi:hypothetical protein